ncbi:ATP-binding cassette domain-containing protein [Anoxybacterium hadale]|uniref:ATP-binding cassette domain-containing protein n=1 Tax=Anoxybacterium hadale TaxID=3408580 RepID=A0ACD1AHM2_9FIRM|nr:ATP-binding cassette domain-containing protein [Clostridiales bacterium]
METIDIVFDRVSFAYGTQVVLKEVSLTLKQGNSYALIGKSGTGKSTLLNLLAGFLKPASGMITVDGAEIRGPRKDTGFLFQDLGLFPWQTVYEAVSMPLKVGQKDQDHHSLVMELISEMKLERHIKKYPHELSGGEKQRTALARTLITSPDLLLMDEPTSALDAMTKEELQTLILREQKKRKTTLVFVTHDIEEAILLGQTILIMNENGTVTQIKNQFVSNDGSNEGAKEQLDFYDACIKLRKRLNDKGESERSGTVLL